MGNPFTHFLFVPLAVAMISLFVVSGGVVAYAERRNLAQITKSSLFKQWSTGFALAVCSMLAILTGGYVLALLLFVAITIGILEYSSVTGLNVKQRNALLLSGAAVCATAVFGGTSALPAVLVLSFLVMAFVSMHGSDGANFDKAAVAGLGVIYLPFLSIHAYLLTLLPGGAGWLLALVVATAGADTGAFVCGKLFGKKLFNGKKLAPSLSPNKTWAGVVGGVIGSYAGFTLMQFAVGPLPLLVKLVLPLIVVVCGIAGDLFESLMKRSYGVKDAGTWLPGFGGILDRIDAMIFVMPAVYYFLVLVAFR